MTPREQRAEQKLLRETIASLEKESDIAGGIIEGISLAERLAKLHGVEGSYLGTPVLTKEAQQILKALAEVKVRYSGALERLEAGIGRARE